MEIHLPKPLHGMREFLKEVGIIVLGVLIALGAEEAVQDWHWRRETEAARDALWREARDNLAAASRRSQMQPCAERRLREIGVMFKAHEDGRPIHIDGPVGRPVSYFGSTAAWQVEVASQALSHMSLKDRLAFATAFNNYENMNGVLRLEQDAWLRLDVLNNPQQLEAGDWPPLRQAYAQAQSLSARLGIITNAILASQNLGQTPEQLENQPAAVTAAIKLFCEPIMGHPESRIALTALPR